MMTPQFWLSFTDGHPFILVLAIAFGNAGMKEAIIIYTPFFDDLRLDSATKQKNFVVTHDIYDYKNTRT